MLDLDGVPVAGEVSDVMATRLVGSLLLRDLAALSRCSVSWAATVHQRVTSLVPEALRVRAIGADYWGNQDRPACPWIRLNQWGRRMHWGGEQAWCGVEEAVAHVLPQRTALQILLSVEGLLRRRYPTLTYEPRPRCGLGYKWTDGLPTALDALHRHGTGN